MKIANYSNIYKADDGKVMADIMTKHGLLALDFGIDDSMYNIQKNTCLSSYKMI